MGWMGIISAILGALGNKDSDQQILGITGKINGNNKEKPDEDGLFGELFGMSKAGQTYKKGKAWWNLGKSIVDLF